MSRDDKKYFNPHLTVILKQLCLTVGCDYDSFNFNDSKWYQKYEWTKYEEDDFKEWMNNYLKKNKEARCELMAFPSGLKEAIDKCVEMFIFNYGWKIKE